MCLTRRSAGSQFAANSNLEVCGALTGRTNPGTLPKLEPTGLKYDPKADRRSWEVMKTFLAEVFA
jgi:hypothetical protein